MSFFNDMKVPKIEELQEYTYGDKLTMIATGQVPNEDTGELENGPVMKRLGEIEDAAKELKSSIKAYTAAAPIAISDANVVSIDLPVYPGTAPTTDTNGIQTAYTEGKTRDKFPTDANVASSWFAHAEGFGTTASGASSHAEGVNTTASGASSHAEGFGTTASGDSSHAEGGYTIAQRKFQHVFGEFNVADTEGTDTTRGTYVEIVGNGTYGMTRSNARTLAWDGTQWNAGDVTCATEAGSSNNYSLRVIGAVTASIPSMEYGTSNSINVGAGAHAVVDVTFGSTKTEAPVVFTSLQCATAGVNIIATVQSVTNTQASIVVTNLGTTDVEGVTVNWLALSGR